MDVEEDDFDATFALLAEMSRLQEQLRPYEEGRKRMEELEAELSVCKVHAEFNIGQVPDPQSCVLLSFDDASGTESRALVGAGPEPFIISVAFFVNDDVRDFDVGEAAGSIRNLLYMHRDELKFTSMKSKLEFVTPGQIEEEHRAVPPREGGLCASESGGGGSGGCDDKMRVIRVSIFWSEEDHPKLFEVLRDIDIVKPKSVVARVDLNDKPGAVNDDKNTFLQVQGELWGRGTATLITNAAELFFGSKTKLLKGGTILSAFADLDMKLDATDLGGVWPEATRWLEGEVADLTSFHSIKPRITPIIAEVFAKDGVPPDLVGLYSSVLSMLGGLRELRVQYNEAVLTARFYDVEALMMLPTGPEVEALVEARRQEATAGAVEPATVSTDEGSSEIPLESRLHTLHCLVLGNTPGAGKSTLVGAFSQLGSEAPPLAVESTAAENKKPSKFRPAVPPPVRRVVSFGGEFILSVQDTGSMMEWDNFKQLRKMMFQADVFLLVCDVTRPESFQCVETLYNDIVACQGSSRAPLLGGLQSAMRSFVPCCFVVGNKSDLVHERAISEFSARSKVQELGRNVGYLDVSALNAAVCEEVLLALIRTRRIMMGLDVPAINAYRSREYVLEAISSQADQLLSRLREENPIEQLISCAYALPAAPQTSPKST